MGDFMDVSVDDDSWAEVVESSEGPVAVMFYSPTCPHCIAMEPYFREYAQEFSGRVLFARINVLENISLARRYGVMSTPTFKFFCKGKPVQELVGAAYPPLLKKIVSDLLQYGSECAGRSTPIGYA